MTVESSEVAACPNCENPFESCTCTCPFCGESEHCRCAIGTEAATGGG